jgi:hypothetical protein
MVEVEAIYDAENPPLLFDLPPRFVALQAITLVSAYLCKRHLARGNILDVETVRIR